MNRNNQVQNWKAGVAILSLAFAVSCTQKMSYVSKDGQGGGNQVGQTATDGSTSIKNFDQYYNALRLATGNVKQNMVATSSGSTNALTYYTNAASNVLPQNTLPASMTTAAAETYPKLASYFAADFIISDLSMTPANRRALGPVGTVTNTATSTPFTKAIAEQVAANEIALFLNRAATPADMAAVDVAYKTIYGTTSVSALGSLTTASSGTTPPATVEEGLEVITTAILASSEMTTSN